MHVCVAYILSAAYFLAALLLAVYGLNCFVLTGLYLRTRGPHPPPGEGIQEWPSVTVQLPLYNERWVARRLLDAVAALDYPSELLEIQVLDDSTDHTASIARAVARRWQRAGLDVKVIHRDHREGYKAGALANGLRQAKGELVAIFDADFVPQPDWLRQVVPHFQGHPNLGFVQTRWGHLNGTYSAVTRAQALALDGHFVVEQTARQRSGLLMNFNGTAGIWRRRCIEETGGWSARTLSEDLDLSYRAQLAGWDCLYLPDVVTPAEVPPLVSAFKRQQARWATGSVQCLRHLAGPLLRSHLGWWQKVEGLIHLGGYLTHPLMVMLLLISLPLVLLDGGLRFHIAFLGLASLGPPLLYVVSQVVQGRQATRRLLHLPVLVLLGTGAAVSNTLAVLRALRQDGGSFQRTPKFRLVGTSGEWRGKRYSANSDLSVGGEVILAGYALAAILVALSQGSLYAVPFLGLYALAFSYIASEGLRETWSARASARRTSALKSPASWPWPT